jgi:predicted RNA-binding Zn-ribbon protein involved in translation (DUF1610 family)
MPEWIVTFWLCPSCGNYYGASAAGNLEKQMNTDAKGQETFPRNRCPQCGDRRTRCDIGVELEARAAS